MYKNIAIVGRVWYIIVIICWLRENPPATPLGVFCVVNIYDERLAEHDEASGR